MKKNDKRNAYLYCKFRDEQYALYDEYAKRHGLLMKTLLVLNVLYYAPSSMTQKEICHELCELLRLPRQANNDPARKAIVLATAIRPDTLMDA